MSLASSDLPPEGPDRAPIAPAPAPAAERRAPGRKLDAAARGFLLSVLLPLGATLGTLRYLVPTRLDGGSGGFFAFVARMGDEHPLLLGIVLFLLFSESIRYWRDLGRPRRRRSVTIRQLGAILVVALALLAVVRASFIEVYRVVSHSMVPTFNVGDRLVVNKRAYGFRLPFSNHVMGAKAPRRGDIVVFPSDPARDGDGPKALVKRVIGLEGDVVAFEGGVPVINGWYMPICDAGPFVSAAGPVLARGRVAVEFLDDQAYLTIWTPHDPNTFAGYKVKPGEVFVMGDDRDMSSDSRAWNGGRGGGVPVGSILGRVSRLGIGALADGRLDFSRLLAPLALGIHEPRMDVRKLEERIAACLKDPPKVTTPPAPSAPPAR
jgi:signal peptidase I